jgi:hypothetical protein
MSFRFMELIVAVAIIAIGVTLDLPGKSDLLADIDACVGGSCVTGSGECWETELTNCEPPEGCEGVECDAPTQPCPSSSANYEYSNSGYIMEAEGCSLGKEDKTPHITYCYTTKECRACRERLGELACEGEIGVGEVDQEIFHEGTKASGSECPSA